MDDESAVASSASGQAEPQPAPPAARPSTPKSKPPVGKTPRASGDSAASLIVELDALRAGLDERTNDLKRITAEYHNYRKRVERDRSLVAEQATGSVVLGLLPVLDDIDRARDHGDLVGPFAAVAEQLSAALAKFGLEPFGERGDPFDPTRHEAVAHMVSTEVTEPACADVMRRGWLLGDRLLRPALVAVAEPAGPSAAE